MLEDYDADKINAMYQETEKLAESGEADLVIVMMHFGTEYQYTPNSTQEEMVDRLFEAGADIILGSHPHVLQPFEVREIPNGDGTTRQGFVIYSLGNFISSQYIQNSVHTIRIGSLHPIPAIKAGR
ncbi:MAG: CapA family protein [Clostridia bacterium]